MDADGYGPRPGQTPIERLLEDAQTLSPLGVERAAQGWAIRAASGDAAAWKEAERAALGVLESTGRHAEWTALQDRILGLTESANALVSWRLEHGPVGHGAERALLGAALGLLAHPQLDAAHTRALLAPMGEELPWLTDAVAS
ncbi:MAG TPA: hypothetical protein VFO60_00875 [Candidatus Dormibacteraeota bacterium]|nr:hypothetical protein [Candidatus Dormibacteraeota bacterium]